MNAFVKQVLFSRRCPICGQTSASSEEICRSCLNAIKTYSYYCDVCAHPITEKGICGACISTPRAYQRTYSMWVLDDSIKRLVYRLKYGKDLFVANLFANHFYRFIKTKYRKPGDWPIVIIPMPLHWRRHFVRRFNQSTEIAKVLSKYIDIKVDNDACARKKHTQYQASLPLKMRTKNVSHAFKVIKDTNYSHIAILDDVVTTGETVGSLSKALSKSGVQRIDIWSIARAVDE